MMNIVYNQLAVDYNCNPDDFCKDGVIFTVAEKQNGRREMPFIVPRLEIITMGRSTVVNSSKNIMPYVKRKFKGKSAYDILTSKIVYGVNPYYLPDVENIKIHKDTKASLKKNFNDRQSQVIITLKDGRVVTVDIGLTSMKKLKKIENEIYSHLN